jgi:hypothetical protein
MQERGGRVREMGKGGYGVLQPNPLLRASPAPHLRLRPHLTLHPTPHLPPLTSATVTGLPDLVVIVTRMLIPLG